VVPGGGHRHGARHTDPASAIDYLKHAHQALASENSAADTHGPFGALGPGP